MSDHITAQVAALAEEWKRASGIPTPFTNADLEAASPSQRTLWEAADDLATLIRDGRPHAWVRGEGVRGVAYQKVCGCGAVRATTRAEWESLADADALSLTDPPSKRCTCAFVGPRGCVDPSHNPAEIQP